MVAPAPPPETICVNRVARWTTCWGAALVVLLAIWLYAPVVREMALTWWTDDSASHGLLVPPFAIYLAWLRRDRVLAFPAAPDNRGLLGIAAACLIFLTGYIGAEFFLTRLSLVLLLGGTLWTFWGYRRARTLVFPLILLATMVPLPAVVYNALAAPLQLFASRVSTGLLQLLSRTVYRDGNLIYLPGITIGVADSCSGLRALTSLVVGALLLGLVMCPRRRVRAALALLSIPIAIGVNVVRVAGTALLAEYDESTAMGFFHAFSGWLIFVGGLAVLSLTAKALNSLAGLRKDTL